MATNPKSTKSLLFSWKAKDKTGEVVSGKLRSSSRAEVIDNLKSQGYSVNSVVLVNENRSSGRVKKTDIVSFTSQLATMLKAGVPLLQSLDMISSAQKKKVMADVVSNLAQEVRKGSSFSKSLKKFPEIFDDLFVSMVAAGEQSGMLDQLLDRLSGYLEKSMKLRSQIKTALIYPISVMAIAMAVVIMMMLWVIPSFKEIFDNVGAELPALTQMLVDASSFLINHGVKLVVSLAIIVFVVFRIYKGSKSMQRSFHRKISKLPIVGSIITLATLSRWARTMTTMVKAGMPLVDALEFSGRSSDNILVFEDTSNVVRQVRSGVSLSVAMRTCTVFPELMIQFVTIGEESGRLEEMLYKVADIYEEEVDVMVRNLSSLLEPIIIFVLGGTVAFIITAMYMPIFKMGEAVS
ncbi:MULTISPECIES: type II secretion system F family protein [Candidatus Ichthyocystis]|uniref:Type II secretion system protein F n=1 Tax=Candidatus Ichthyocystis hellenicum TaxID=1561003 RepID=A0A0S4M5P5_9BURK|nr:MULTISPECIES: type II secretion system F family protein [Ichthyocystis]CUT17448.1 type II secretion system protein F [Candidatus Ichthyocystis hellenicum]